MIYYGVAGQLVGSIRVPCLPFPFPYPSIQRPVPTPDADIQPQQLCASRCSPVFDSSAELLLASGTRSASVRMRMCVRPDACSATGRQADCRESNAAHLLFGLARAWVGRRPTSNRRPSVPPGLSRPFLIVLQSRTLLCHHGHDTDQGRSGQGETTAGGNARGWT